MSVRVMLLALAIGACGRARAQQAPVQPPADEVWLTEQQVRDSKIEVAPLSKERVDDIVATGGRIAFDDQRVAHVFSPVSGRVVKLTAGLGDRVARGGSLAVIESPDVGATSADLSKAYADYIASEHDYRREKALWERPDGHATSHREFELAEDAFRRAAAELARARHKASLLGSADAVTQRFILRAGIAGEVISRTATLNVEVQGQYAGGDAVELFTIGELDRVWLLGDLYEMDLGRVKVGAKAIVQVVAYPNRIFEGTVDWISGTLDPVTRTARMRCSFANPDRMLRPEMFATVRVVAGTREALAIPRSALFRLAETTVVLVRTGNTPDGRVRFRRVPVTVRDEGQAAGWLMLERGPAEGSPIVVNGGILLTGG